ncbi:MAG: N-acetylmuramoyl-L-alanine amidase [Saprospiraceae bacterium]
MTLAFFSLNAVMQGESIVNGEYHKVKARNGDGINILLQRYELHRDSRLRNAFLNLNNLKKNQHLIHSRVYNLPVKLYNYDGKSIRSTIGVQDWDKAVRIKKYNESILAKGIRSTHYSDSKILWVPVSELVNLKTLPTPLVIETKAKIVKVKIKQQAITLNNIYGKKNKLKKASDNSLKGKVYYIVSGHGGPDPGAMCKTCDKTLCEDEYAYDVSLRIARNLEEHGAIVEMVVQDKNDGIRDGSYLPCDKDERLANGEKLPINQLKRLVQRTNYINRKHEEYSRKGYKDQVVVSIHVDANSKSTQQDVFFCYYRHSKQSKLLAGQIRNTFAEKYKKHQSTKNYRGSLHERGIYVLRKTNPPAVLIELANINNPYNHKRIRTSANRQALANWIFEGLTKNVRSTKSDQIIASS